MPAINEGNESVAAAMAPSGGTPAGTRASKNIADWSEYLPADCVSAMVSFGWDRTT
jgi:hypothetical protein